MLVQFQQATVAMNQDSSRMRLSILGMVVLSLFCALLARLWYLQVLVSPSLKLQAQQNSVAVEYTEAPRGRILDRNGRVLADNRVVLALVAKRDQLEEHPDVLPRLSSLLGVPLEQLNERLAAFVARMESSNSGTPSQQVPVEDANQPPADDTTPPATGETSRL